MEDTVDLHLSPETLQRYGLPDIAYPIPRDQLGSVAGSGSNLPFAVMLHCLQLRSAESQHWKDLEAAMDALAAVIAPDDDQTVVATTGGDWWLEIGPVDLDGRIVTIQRDGELVAALSPTQGGRLRVATFRPLDARAASLLRGLGQLPHPEHGVCMRANNWEYALDASSGAGQMYAADRGESYLSYWERGIGLSSDGAEINQWRAQRNLIARNTARTAIELNIACAHAEDWTAAPAESARAAPELAAVFAECSAFYRDADLPAEIVALYEIGLVFREPTLCDATNTFGGFAASHRYLIISANAQCIDAYSAHPEWGLCVWKPGSLFKVIALHRRGGFAQTTLLEIPEESLSELPGTPLSAAELHFASMAEERFIAAQSATPNAEHSTRSWLTRVALPLGVKRDGTFFEAWR